MADSFKAKQITSLTENTSMADTDIVPVGNAGTSTLRRIKWANILAAIKSKITSWTYNFNTSSKTLEGAVNEMHGDITALNNGLISYTIRNIDVQIAGKGFADVTPSITGAIPAGKHLVAVIPQINTSGHTWISSVGKNGYNDDKYYLAAYNWSTPNMGTITINVNLVVLFN